MNKFNADQLRKGEVPEDVKKSLKKNPVYIIADNVLDTYNVGSIFRLADAVAATKVYLCGGTETPPHTRIKKASINTTEIVDWEYAETAMDAIKKLRAAVPGIQVISVEQSPKSTPYDTIPYSFPVAVIVGHETTGVTQEAMDASDYIAEMPMWGVNISMNVVVSLGIALFEIMKHLSKGSNR